MQIDGKTRMAAVVANPIRHSLSPFIHNEAFRLTDENGVYVAWEVAENDLAQTLANIRLLDMYGVNLSMPFKQLAMWYVNELSEEAKLIGAINTIVNVNGQLVGHNTDGIGFFKSLSEEQNFDVAGKELTVLGGGGAAVAIIATAALQKAAKINVFARRSSSFAALKSKIETLSALTKVDIQLTDLADEKLLADGIASSSLLANATSIGMDGMTNPLPEAFAFPENLLVADVIYKVAETPLLKAAKLQGCAMVNGLGMLLYQAAESFKLWTGKTMPADEIRAALTEKFAHEKS